MEAVAGVLREKNWRFGYAKHVVENVEVGMELSLACFRGEACVLDCFLPICGSFCLLT